jgi:hypothetical protein
MLVWFAIASQWSHRTAWWVPNLVASAFYGDASLNLKAGGYTIVGIAMIFFAYGLLGLFFGLFMSDGQLSLRLIIVAVIGALAIHYVMLRVFWKIANPVAHLYAPDTQILIAHLLFACALLRFPRALAYVKR